MHTAFASLCILATSTVGQWKCGQPEFPFSEMLSNTDTIVVAKWVSGIR